MEWYQKITQKLTHLPEGLSWMSFRPRVDMSGRGFYDFHTYGVFCTSLPGALAQLVARLNGIEKVRSSNLLCSTSFRHRNLPQPSQFQKLGNNFGAFPYIDYVDEHNKRETHTMRGKRRISPTSKQLQNSKNALMNSGAACYTVAEAAQILDKSIQTITNWCKTGRIQALPVPFGLKVTWQIPQISIELIKQQEKVKEARKNSFTPIKDTEKQLDLLPVFDKACLNGVIGGRSFSERTIEVNHYYIDKFLNKYGVANSKTLKQELADIHPELFAKREKTWTALRCFMKWMVDEGFADVRILEGFPDKPKRHKPPKRTSLTEEQLDQMEAACKNIYEKTVVIVLSQTGIRSGEFCNLRCEDIDLENRVLYIRKAKWGKTRKVALTRKAAETLQAYLEEHPRKPKDRMFLNSLDKPLHRDGLINRLRRIGQRVGVHAHPHAMRRAFVTINIAKGRSIVDIQVLCGHTRISTTREYCQTTNDDAVSRMKDWD